MKEEIKVLYAIDSKLAKETAKALGYRIVKAQEQEKHVFTQASKLAEQLKDVLGLKISVLPKYRIRKGFEYVLTLQAFTPKKQIAGSLMVAFIPFRKPTIEDKTGCFMMSEIKKLAAEAVLTAYRQNV